MVVGPADLTMALGEKRNLGSPVIESAIRKITSTALAADKFVGAGMGVDVDFAIKLADTASSGYRSARILTT